MKISIATINDTISMGLDLNSKDTAEIAQVIAHLEHVKKKLMDKYSALLNNPE